MTFQNCLKISYKGLTRKIICDSIFRYEDVVSKVMETFELTNMHRNTIQIYDEQGSKFTKEVFEYFLLLFPNPQKLFFIRLDTSSMVFNNTSTNGINQLDAMDRKAFTVSKSVNKIKDTTNTHNEAVPVRRQNCFIGQWPSSITSAAAAPNVNMDTSSKRQQQQNNLVLGIVKRMKMLQESQHKRKTITTPTIVKRSMRI